MKNKFPSHRIYPLLRLAGFVLSRRICNPAQWSIRIFNPQKVGLKIQSNEDFAEQTEIMANETEIMANEREIMANETEIMANEM
ncbi:MAG: hypothetical protein LBT42_07345, partial [Tannerella sp.]|nr:hypothetical protein [Tannerella sp.]